MLEVDWLAVVSLVLALVWALGALSAIHAVMTPRSPRGAVSWALALLVLPWVSLPVYWVLGRPKFNGYVESSGGGNSALQAISDALREDFKPLRPRSQEIPVELKVLERLAGLPITRGNHARLLVDGAATFKAIFAAIDAAEEYLLIQFYILREDELGKQLIARLEARAKDGIQICVLYDEIGNGLENSTIERLRRLGIQVSGFKATKGRANRFQLNFRNHRKLVVVDGQRAFLGGLNVGDEYMGRDPRLSPWRDTFIGLEGPAALAVQLSFQEDWFWATGAIGDWSWTPVAVGDPGQFAFVLPSGPADELETCALFFVHAINSAKQRIWLATPYFVPDDKVIQALALAALRGVDVRILLPGITDMKLIKLAGLSFIEEVLRPGIKMFRFQNGFMHQKVMLLDDRTACIGTANFDNRSFRLNFEITGLVVDEEFAHQVEQMLAADFAASVPIRPEDLTQRSYAVRVASRVARLFSPIL